MYKLRLATTQCGRAANVFAKGKEDFIIIILKRYIRDRENCPTTKN